MVLNKTSENTEEHQLPQEKPSWCTQASLCQSFDDGLHNGNIVNERCPLESALDCTDRLDQLLMESVNPSNGAGILKDVIANPTASRDATSGKTNEGMEMPEFEDWASNFCFLLGSIIYVLVALCDLVRDAEGSSKSKWVKTMTAKSPKFVISPHYRLTKSTAVRKVISRMRNVVSVINFSPSAYMALSAAGALSYMVDASFQMLKLARYKSKTNSDRQNPMGKVDAKHHHPNLSATTVETIYSDDDEEFHYFFHNHGHVEIMEVVEQNDKNEICFDRKVVRSSLVVATFGGGAFLQFVAALFTDRASVYSTAFNDMGVHLYLLNAVLLTWPIFLSTPCTLRIFFQSDKSKSCCRGDSLEYCGDLLFLIGSVIDLILSYWDLETKNKTIVNWFHVLSAILWLIDAVFYIAADCLAIHDNEHASAAYRNEAGSAGSALVSDELRIDDMTLNYVRREVHHFTETACHSSETENLTLV